MSARVIVFLVITIGSPGCTTAPIDSADTSTLDGSIAHDAGAMDAAIDGAVDAACYQDAGHDAFVTIGCDCHDPGLTFCLPTSRITCTDGRWIDLVGACEAGSTSPEP